MDRYTLVNSDGEELSISDKTLRILSRSFSVQLDIIERSYKAGANLIGIPRQESAGLEFQYQQNSPQESSFRDYMNNFLYWLNNTILLRDNILQIETEVIMESNEINYDNGGFNLGTTGNVITFRQLKPFWEDSAATVISESGTNLPYFYINNTGYIETPSIITVTALESITKFSFRVLESQHGILIEDTDFGTNGLNTYIIDNSDGVVELSGLNRNNKIRSGTGFFNFPVGKSTLEFISNGNAQVEISYKRRYYI